VYTGMILRK